MTCQEVICYNDENVWGFKSEEVMSNCKNLEFLKRGGGTAKEKKHPAIRRSKIMPGTEINGTQLKDRHCGQQCQMLQKGYEGPVWRKVLF